MVDSIWFSFCDMILSVRKVVPTLTSNERRGLSLNGRCWTTNDTSFILVPAEGPYVQQWCARGTILLSTGVPVVGRLQARRERERGSQVLGEVAEDVVGESESKCMMCCVLTCLLCSVSCPLRRGSSSSFYKPRRERITCMPRYLATWGSMVCYAVE
jgi:hypothetical protein